MAEIATVFEEKSVTRSIIKVGLQLMQSLKIIIRSKQYQGPHLARRTFGPASNLSGHLKHVDNPFFV